MSPKQENSLAQEIAMPKPTIKRPCTGGPCPHCSVVDHETIRAHVANIVALLEHAPDAETKAALAKMAMQAKSHCPVCKNKGFIRVCARVDGGCDGRGHTVVIRKELTQATHTKEDGTQFVVEEMRDVEFNGEQCSRCKGCGHEAIDESQVGVQ